MAWATCPASLAKLDYVASLGVEAIWVSPFFKSPMADFGYDIADYRAVDPIFGTLADFDRLIARAHGLGLKVIIDQVLSHTSDQHAWFQESRQSRTNPKSDWYVWADAREDGTPPNNWLSIFGGVAWTWEPRRGQYYLHNFLSEQPDLNFHNADVRQASIDNMRFWLDRGVDGLRLDAINFCFHDAKLRDNPARPKNLRKAKGVSADNPYGFQWHRHNNTQPEMLPYLEEIRRMLDEYPDVVALGEISSDDSTATVAEYTQPGRLHMAYSFELLSNDSSPAHIRATVETLNQRAPQSWPCWTISNHDVERVVSRWGRSMAAPHMATQLSCLVASLRGSVCVFQGEELGLAEADVPFEALRDPYGIAFWPTFKGRDGCRTPMPWDATPRARLLERRAVAAGAGTASAAVGRGPGARYVIGVARLPATARVAQAAAVAAQWRYRIPGRHRIGAGVPPLRFAGVTAGRVQSVGGTGERRAARHHGARSHRRSRASRGEFC